MVKGIQDRRVFAEGQIVFHEGQEGNAGYLIARGKIEISKQTETGRHVIAVIGENDIFGEMALIDDSLRMATATALLPTECIVITQAQLNKKLDLIGKDTRLVIAFLLKYTRGTEPWEYRAEHKILCLDTEMDATAAVIVASRDIALSMENLDPFLRGFFEVLVNYANRRLPPYLVDEK